MYAYRWLNLETTMPNRRIQAQKVTLSYDSFYMKFRNGNSIETGSELVVSRGKGKGGMRHSCWDMGIL